MVAGFDGGDITSNGGALVLGQVDRGLGPNQVEFELAYLYLRRAFSSA